jgi:uncharacterized phiE125 gp8 family phage protein
MNLNTVFRGPNTVDPPRLTLVTEASVEPWVATDTEVQEWLRIDDGQEVATLNRLLKAARRYFERITGLNLIQQQWRVTFDEVPLRQGQYGLEYGLAPSMSRFTGTPAGRQIVLPRAPLVSVDNFQYLDSTGALQTYANTNYTVGSVGVATTFGRLWLNEGADWPDTGPFPGALRITFTAGLATTAAGLPEDITTALLMLAAHWYENRLPVSADGLGDVPSHLQSLIEMHRVAFIG